MSFIKERYRIAQRLGVDFAKAGKRSIAFTDSYQAEVSESESFEQGSEADCAKFNAKGKSGSKFTQKIVNKLSKIWIWDPGSEKTYSGSGTLGKTIA